MNEVQGEQASRTRAMFSNQHHHLAPISPGNVPPSHLLQPPPPPPPSQYSTNSLHSTNPYLAAAAAAYYNQFAMVNSPNFVVPTSPAAPGPYFGYPHSMLSNLANHSQSQLHQSLVPHSPTSPNDSMKTASHTLNGTTIHPRSPSSPKELSRSDHKSAFTSSGKRKAEAGSSPGSMSIMRNRLSRPPDIAIHNYHSNLREQVPLSAPPTQTQFKDMSLQYWMEHRNVTGETAAQIAAPLSAPPVPDDEKGDRHFNYPRFSSSFARSSDENVERCLQNEARNFTSAAARTVRKTSSLESESMDGMANKSDQGSPSTSASSVTPPTVNAATTNGSQYPTSPGICCYRKGSIIQLADKSLKKIEDMKTQDFLSCVASSRELVLDSSTIIEIEMRNSFTAFITFSVGKKGMKNKVEVPLDHPFFVYHHGWSSCSPDRARKVHQLDTRLLSVGDNCITLSRRVRESSVNRMGSNVSSNRQEYMMAAHRANPVGQNIQGTNYSSGSDQHHEEDDEEYSSLPMNLKKNRNNEMEVDENQNNMRQASLDGKTNDITTQ